MPPIVSLETSVRRPIGVFDSGIGGLTVVDALRKVLPHEALLYLGDTARVPYGTRSAGVVRRYAQHAAEFLLARGAKMVVVACNTASAHALQALQSSLPVPVVGVVEASAAACAQQVTVGPVAVLATESTVHSQAYQRALARLAPRLQVVVQACPMLVPLAEEGLSDHPAARLFVAEYMRPLLAQGVRAIVLGCTHYPMFAALLAQVCGPEVAIVDSATSVAQWVARSLREARLGADPSEAGARPHPSSAPLTVCATDVTTRLKRVAASFLGGPVPEVELVDL